MSLPTLEDMINPDKNISLDKNEPQQKSQQTDKTKENDVNRSSKKKKSKRKEYREKREENKKEEHKVEDKKEEINKKYYANVEKKYIFANGQEEVEKVKKPKKKKIVKKEKEELYEIEEDKRVLYLVQCLVESSFVKDKNDERLTKDIVNKLFDFLDKPKCVQLFIKFKDEKETELLCRENILELYDPTANRESQENNLTSGTQNFISRIM